MSTPTTSEEALVQLISAARALRATRDGDQGTVMRAVGAVDGAIADYDRLVAQPQETGEERRHREMINVLLGIEQALRNR